VYIFQDLNEEHLYLQFDNLNLDLLFKDLYASLVSSYRGLTDSIEPSGYWLGNVHAW